MITKILIATPCFNNQLYTGYFHSIIKTIDCLTKLNIKFDIATIGNESLVTRGRNYFVSNFLSNPQYTHLLFIDADITFNPLSIVRMINADKDIIAGAYPKKAVYWDKIISLIQSASNVVPFPFLQEITSDYAINLKAHTGDTSDIKLENGFLQIAYAATGFMLIKRQVIETMIKEYPELKYENDVQGYSHGTNNEYFYSLFDCFIDPVSKRYLSEDYAFCKRWIQLNGEIWLDLLCNLNHYGSFEFKGNYIKHLEFNNLLQPTTKN
jgi:hypothetical protein